MAWAKDVLPKLLRHSLTRSSAAGSYTATALR
jgi:hypothetical protein